jgi:two-component system phosphate regulon sensor histidine kinase PhoR
VTRLLRLEKIRREFVANVSHEIKTPITAIKGFVETLRDGAVKNPEYAERFLEIIDKHVKRLEAIINDLLRLSKIERKAGAEEVVLKEGRLKEVLETAIQVCEVNAMAKKIDVKLSCSEDIVANFDPSLLEQAFVNLIDNAIKYSGEKKNVQVEAAQAEKEIIISVSDQGCGIEKIHLSRIFERFYRVDKARSREMGGTGLGLAIVKHIAQTHGGHVSVQSTPGKGSVFALHLPKPSA